MQVFQDDNVFYLEPCCSVCLCVVTKQIKRYKLAIITCTILILLLLWIKLSSSEPEVKFTRRFPEQCAHRCLKCDFNDCWQACYCAECSDCIYRNVGYMNFHKDDI